MSVQAFQCPGQANEKHSLTHAKSTLWSVPMIIKNRAIQCITLAVSVAITAPVMAGVTKSPGVLKVAMEATYPPFGSYDDQQRIVGADPEIAAALARQMGVELTIIDAKFPSLIMGLNAGHYDAMISGMYITPERQTQTQTLGYAQSGASVLVPKGSNLKISRAEDLCGTTLGLLQASAWVAEFRSLSSSYCEPQGRGAIVVNEYPSGPEVTQATLSRNVQAQVEMGAAAKMILERTGDRLAIASDKQIYPQTLGIFVKKNNSETYEALRSAFERIKANGEYAAILEKYNLEAAPN